MQPNTSVEVGAESGQISWPALPPGVVLFKRGKELRLGLRVNLGGARVSISVCRRPVMTQGMVARSTAGERQLAIDRVMAAMGEEGSAQELLAAWSAHQETCQNMGLDRAGDRQLTELFDLALWPHVDEVGEIFRKWRGSRAHAMEQERVAGEIARATRIQAYHELFPAFYKRRRLRAVLGPTNSGKTHYALEKLSQAGSGVYCGPLRLLSFEVYTRLNKDWGTPCSLVTGEERRIYPGAQHVACTVEMVDPELAVEAMVIDEVQMIADEQRGWAWTQAIVAANADVVYLTGAPNARPALERLGRILGIEIEFTETQRLSELKVEPTALGKTPLSALKQVRPGDGLVVFSRRDCLALRDCLMELGHEVSAVYGSLSPEVRASEAERFSSGKARVLVATDAIGLGLNLKGLERVILVASQKYDGRSIKDVPPDLIRQIVGRAGRYGQTQEDTGLACGLTKDEHELVVDALSKPAEGLQLERFAVGPSGDILAKLESVSGERRLEVLLRLFLAHCRGDDFEPRVTSECLSRASHVDRLSLPVHTRFLLTQVPISSRDGVMHQAWWSWCLALERSEPADIGFLADVTAASSLARLEEAVQLLNGYRWLALKAPDVFPMYDECTAAIGRLSAAVATRLKSRASLGENAKQSRGGLPAWYWRRRQEDEYF